MKIPNGEANLASGDEAEKDGQVDQYQYTTGSHIIEDYTELSLIYYHLISCSTVGVKGRQTKMLIQLFTLQLY